MKKEISFPKFVKELSKKRFIMLGEIHGTKEIPKIVQKILVSLAKNQSLNLFLEVPVNQQKFLSKKTIPFYKHQKVNDGRNSKEYFDLIKSLRSKIKIFFIDPLDWKNRDYKMYKNIKKIMNKNNNSGIFLAGNIHTSTRIFKWQDKTIKSAGCFLKKSFSNVANLNFIPLSGKFFNLSVKEVPENKKANFFKDKIIKINKNKYAYYLSKVSPCSFMK